MKTKLTEIINIGIEKGFTVFRWAKKHKDYELEVTNKSHIKFKFDIVKKPYGEGNFEDDTFRIVPKGHSYYIFSLNDLLFSPESNLMQALFGSEKLVVTFDGVYEMAGRYMPGKDWETIIPAYRYHHQQLLPLSDQERILYLANALGVE